MAPKLKSTVVKTPQPPPKRRRTKKLHKELLEQLEFYLSEANLRHDGWMRDIAGERGMKPIPVNVFISFHLIQELKVNEGNIINAVENSQILKLSDDKKYLQRRFPVPRPPHNLEQSTLYIENLPPDSTIEWLNDVCRKVGSVRHISLPRYKRTGLVKGFAFVEFSSPEDVIRACRILKDPPNHFFPLNRAEKYLKRQEKKKLLNQTEFQSSPPTNQTEIAGVPQSAESCCLNKSLDSAIDFELLGHEHGSEETSSGRRSKRRRSRGLSETTATNQQMHLIDEETPTHTPAKKQKSLPTRSSNYADIDQKSTLFYEENSSKIIDSDEVSIKIKKHRTQGRKVLFSINAEDTQKSSQIQENSDDIFPDKMKTENFYHKCDEKSTKLKNNGKSKNLETNNCVENGIPCNVTMEIHKLSSKHCQTHKLTLDERNTISDVETNDRNQNHTNKMKAEFLHHLDSMKRRRSVSEPSNIFDFANSVSDAKKLKEESTEPSFADQLPLTDAYSELPIKSFIPADASTDRPIIAPNILKEQPINASISVATSTDLPINASLPAATSIDPPIKTQITTFDIDAIITQGRQQAQVATMVKNSEPSHDFSSRRILQSVVAKPLQTKIKSRKKSRRTAERKKARLRQIPPKLIVMPKVQWTDLKKEYKRIQKHNMSKLKLTMRESKDAGSVFIKKHLDVLKDVNISNDSTLSDESIDDESATISNEQSECKLQKRGPPTFKPGVIVRISALQSKSTAEHQLTKLPGISEIKSRLNKYGLGVAYVDSSTSESCGFVRFNDGDSAQRAIMEEKTLALCLLTGEQEERYWDKLLASRAQKFARERPRIRGRTKILARAENSVEKSKRRHIRFDNDLSV